MNSRDTTRRLRPLTVVACCTLMLAAGWGCVTGNPAAAPAARPLAGSGSIEEVNLLAIPVALNLDQDPGVDGFVIKIYAGNRKRPKPLAIDDGEVEILMYDGIPTGLGQIPPKPARTWKYTAAELRQFEFLGSIGPGYQVTSLWGASKPSRNKIAVVVRYTSPSGASITSAPSIISVAVK